MLGGKGVPKMSETSYMNCRKGSGEEVERGSCARRCAERDDEHEHGVAGGGAVEDGRHRGQLRGQVVRGGHICSSCQSCLITLPCHRYGKLKLVALKLKKKTVEQEAKIKELQANATTAGGGGANSSKQLATLTKNCASLQARYVALVI